MFKRFFFIFSILLSSHSYCFTKSQIPSNNKNTSDMSIEKYEKENYAKIRIGLKIIPFSKISFKSKRGQKDFSFKEDKELKRTLRARMDKPNHFIVGNYHIETIPLKWIKKTQNYMVRLVFSKRYGAYGEVEEHLGDIDVEGRLQGKNGLFVLIGANSKLIRNKSGDPLLKVLAGYGPLKKPKNISRESKHQKASSKPISKTKRYSTFKPRNSSLLKRL